MCHDNHTLLQIIRTMMFPEKNVSYQFGRLLQTHAIQWIDKKLYRKSLEQQQQQQDTKPFSIRNLEIGWNKMKNILDMNRLPL